MKPTTKNDIFDLGRFAHELKRYLREKRKELVPYGISTVALLVIFSISNLYRPGDSDIAMWSLTHIIYFIILCLCVGVSSRAFICLNTVNGALIELTTPSSQFEKYLTRWLVSVALPLVFCVIMIKCVEIVAIKAITLYYTKVYPLGGPSLLTLKTFYSVTGTWYILIVWLQAIFFLGSVGWRKYSSLKTIAVLTLMAILTVTVCGGYIPWLKITYHYTATVIFIIGVPLILYYCAWVLYRRAQVK